MLSEEKEKIMQKRSSLRSWRERRGKTSYKREIIGLGLAAIIFLFFMASSLLNPDSIPMPIINILSPKEITYNNNTPSLSFNVSGKYLNNVLISVDKGPWITIPHNGTVARLDFVKLTPLFIDDFSSTTKGRWKENGNWVMEDGKYKTTGGNSSFGEPEWKNYIIETKMKITSGRETSIDIRWDGQSKLYKVITDDAYGSLQLRKIDNNNYSTLISSKLKGIDLTEWHIWKIVVNGSKIQAFIDATQYIEYEDKKPFLSGISCLNALNTTVEYEYINVYKPLSDGSHNLTIFANNTAANSSSMTINFKINTKPANKTSTKLVSNLIGKIGVPLTKNGFEITVKKVYLGDTYTNVWVSVRNTENKEKPFKLGQGTLLLDNIGQQYENIKIPRSSEIVQTNLYSLSMREGSIFFESLKEGRMPKKMVLNASGEIFEFMLNSSQ